MKPYTLSRTYFMIRDIPPVPSYSLGTLFQDSHTMFKMRVQHLGNLGHVTTDEDSEILRIMLEALIYTKQQLQSANS